MKIFLKITVAIFISLLIFFVGIIKFRQFSANNTLIPKNATSVVKINVDEIYQSLAFNAILNLTYYFNTDKKIDTNSKIKRFKHGLKIPASIYVYTLENMPQNAVFSKLEIKQLGEFEDFIRNVLHLSVVRKGNVHYAKSKVANLLICYNSNTAVIGFSPQPQDFDTTLLNILDKKNLIKLSESKFNLLKTSIDHIAFVNERHNGALNFNSGTIDFTDEFSTTLIIPALNPLHRKFNSQSTIRFWLNANLAHSENKIYKLKNTSLEKDSLAKYVKDYVDFEWLNSISQTDTILTYEYNDDFEKTEKITLQKQEVPNFSINFKADANNLKNYLNSQNIINLDSGLVNKEVFPLYKVFVLGNAQNLMFSTQKSQKITISNQPTKDFFFLDVNFLKLNKQINLPVLTPFFRNLAHLEIKGKVLKANKINVNGKLEMTNQNINSLYQILKNN